eukprot:6201507-Pleurochrysis_carterae.AAC.5
MVTHCSGGWYVHISDAQAKERKEVCDSERHHQQCLISVGREGHEANATHGGNVEAMWKRWASDGQAKGDCTAVSAVRSGAGGCMQRTGAT